MTLPEGGRGAGQGREKVDSGSENTGSRESQQAKEGMGMGWGERHATGWTFERGGRLKLAAAGRKEVGGARRRGRARDDSQPWPEIGAEF